MYLFVNHLPLINMFIVLQPIFQNCTLKKRACPLSGYTKLMIEVKRDYSWTEDQKSLKSLQIGHRAVD
jgi:hypothetical protein